MSTFDLAAEFVKFWEGGYVNHPSDPGGETKFGIAKRSYPDLDIKNLTFEQAKGIWKREYWDRIRGDELPPSVAIAVFDFAINSGVSRATKYLQRAIGVVADGHIGPQTLRGASSRPSDVLVRTIISKRLEFLTTLAMDDEDIEVFLAGWMKRLFSLVWFLQDHAAELAQK